MFFNKTEAPCRLRDTRLPRARLNVGIHLRSCHGRELLVETRNKCDVIPKNCWVLVARTKTPARGRGRCAADVTPIFRSRLELEQGVLTLVRFSKHLKLEFRYLGARLLTFHRELTRGQTAE